MSKLIVINEETNRVSAINLDGKKKVYLTVRNETDRGSDPAMVIGLTIMTNKDVAIRRAEDMRSKTSSDASMNSLIKRALARKDGNGSILVMATKGCKALSASKYYSALIKKYPLTSISNDILAVRVR